MQALKTSRQGTASQVVISSEALAAATQTSLEQPADWHWASELHSPAASGPSSLEAIAS